MNIIERIWARFWMLFAGYGKFGKMATWFATWVVPPYTGRHYLKEASRNQIGFISPRAEIHHSKISFGKKIFIDDRVLISEQEDGGPVQLYDLVTLHRDVIILTGAGGAVTIGPDTRIQPRCILSGYKGRIIIKKGVGIGPMSVLYPYNHGVAPDKPIRQQPLETKGDIIIEEHAWIGAGVTVLDGVRIGKGAVVGAGSVVTNDIPDGAMAFGVPARVIKMRGEINK